MKQLTIMKFGGSSVATGEKMLHVARIVVNYKKKNSVIIVISAMQGVTDQLIDIYSQCQQNKLGEAMEHIRQLYILHNTALEQFKLPSKKYDRCNKVLLHLFGQLTMYLMLHKNYTKNNYDFVVSFGERLSSFLLALAITTQKAKAKAVTASEIIFVDNDRPLIKQSKQQSERLLLPMIYEQIIPVVTGFLATSKEGQVVTLGRGGSDYTATILANILDAGEVILWKEVDGVFTSDPKEHTDAVFYPELSYHKALSLAQNGAKILHPQAMKPVAEKNIIIWVKNTFYPERQGTKISKKGYI